MSKNRIKAALVALALLAGVVASSGILRPSQLISSSMNLLADSEAPKTRGG